MSLSPCPVWPFCCKSCCSWHHVQHATTSISRHYWLISWSNTLTLRCNQAHFDLPSVCRLGLLMSLWTCPQHMHLSFPQHTMPLTVFVCVCVCDVSLSMHTYSMYAWPILEVLSIRSEPAVTLREQDDFLPLLALPLKQPHFLINTSGPQRSRFKVISLKLSFWAWSNPSLPFTLLPVRVFLYRFIKLIPFLPGLWERSEWIIIPHSVS